MTTSTAKLSAPTVLATLVRADGTVMQLMTMTEEDMAAAERDAPKAGQVGELKKLRQNRGAILKGLQTEQKVFVQTQPVLDENGKQVGTVVVECKTAVVTGRIALKALDLRRFAGK